MKKTLLILTTLFVSVIGYSQTFTDNYIDYDIISNAPTYIVQITGYDYTNGGPSVNIPATVTYNSTNYNVTVIGDQAFKDASLTSVTIPNGVTFIGYNSFNGNMLSSVTLPDSVTHIGNLVFFNNYQLTSVVLSENLSYIPLGAFQGCNLSSIIIPESVTSIQSNAFINNQLTSVTLPSNISVISARAFRGNPFTSITTLDATPTSVTRDMLDDSFSLNRGSIDLIVPQGALSAYTANYNWGGFNSVTEDASLSTSDFELTNNIKIITKSDRVEIISSNSTELKHYEVYSISGAKVKSGKAYSISTEALSNGIYILKLTFNNGEVTKKFVK